METFEAYEREDGRIGIRNHVLVLSVEPYANTTVRNISNQVTGVQPVYNQFGRSLRGRDAKIQDRTLIGIGCNPNVGAVLVVGWEPEHVNRVASEISKTGKPVEIVTVLDSGTLKATAKGSRKAKYLIQDVEETPLIQASLGDLVVGVECGGSDTTSGIASNPITGSVVDEVLDSGGQSIFSETLEIMGAEEILISRAASSKVAGKIHNLIEENEAWAKEIEYNINDSNPAPDNVEGGLTTLEEKSIGAIQKSGTHPIQGVLEYGEAPSSSGLFFMDTPTPASPSMTGKVAAGAQVILFSTGQGNPAGTPVAPVIKVCGNSETTEKMSDHIDVDVSNVISKGADDQQAIQKLLEELVAVASSKPTAAETLGHQEFAIHRTGQWIPPSFISGSVDR
jgi:altronate dehydratase large subunit